MVDTTGSEVLLAMFRKEDYCIGDETLITVKKLLDMGCDPNTPDENGRTTLHLLALRQQTFYDLELLSVLLENGADPTVRDNWGNVAVNYNGTRQGAHHTFIFILLRCMTSQGEWNSW